MYIKSKSQIAAIRSINELGLKFMVYVIKQSKMSLCKIKHKIIENQKHVRIEVK